MPALVYVVDDDKIIATTLVRILNQNGFEARAFFSLLDALDAAKEDCPDILISDGTMPEMSGIELAIQFKTKIPKCRVLLISGEVSTSDLLERARVAGHDFQFLLKPFHPKELLAALKRI